MDTFPLRMHDASASQQQSTGPAHHRRSITLLTEVPSQWRESLAEMQIIRSDRDTAKTQPRYLGREWYFPRIQQAAFLGCSRVPHLKYCEGLEMIQGPARHNANRSGSHRSLLEPQEAAANTLLDLTSYACNTL